MGCTSKCNFEGVQSSQAAIHLLIPDHLAMDGTAHSVVQLYIDLGKRVSIEDTCF